MGAMPGAPGKSLAPYHALQCSYTELTCTNHAFRELVSCATLYEFPRPCQALQCNFPMCYFGVSWTYLHFTDCCHSRAVSWKGTKLSFDEMPHPSIFQQVLWELNKISFHFEFFSLDRRASTLNIGDQA